MESPPERSRRGRSRGSLEREVVSCLAAADEPMTVAQVQAEIGPELAYNTVMTALSRLYEKGALVRSARGRAYAYSVIGGSAGARANLTAHQMKKLLDAGADRAGVLSRFVYGLDPQDEALLRQLLGHPDSAPGREEDE